MARDYILVDNDQIQITLDPPTVCRPLSSPVSLKASGFSAVQAGKVCVVGDELPASLQVDLPYTSGNFTIPGIGRVSVTLAPANKTRVAKDNGKALLLKGQSFQAKFTVTSPATQPGPAATPDPVTTKTGTAEFLTANTIALAE